jgi:hypothetical protein
VTPAVSKDQRCLTQQLVCHHVSYPNLCNKFSESMRGTVSPVSGCVTDLHESGPGDSKKPGHDPPQKCRLKIPQLIVPPVPRARPGDRRRIAT